MKKVFNLKRYIKTAFYDDGRGLHNMQTRAFSNCWKIKVDGDMEPQEAWNSCLKSYQEASDRSEWVKKYTSVDGALSKLPDLKTPAAKKIKSK